MIFRGAGPKKKATKRDKFVNTNKNVPKFLFADTYLTHHEFITVVVTRQVREDASSTCHNINVITAQQLDQRSQKTLHSLLQRSQVVLREKKKKKKNPDDKSIPDEIKGLYKKLLSWR